MPDSNPSYRSVSEGTVPSTVPASLISVAASTGGASDTDTRQDLTILSGSHRRGENAKVEGCKFCDILLRGNFEVLYKDDCIIIVKDQFPAAAVHLLAIPRTHIESIWQLKPEHIGLLEHLAGQGLIVFKKQSEQIGSLGPARINYRWWLLWRSSDKVIERLKKRIEK